MSQENLGFSYTESNGVVSITPSDADNDYIYNGSFNHALATIAPVVVIAFILGGAALGIQHYYGTDDVSLLVQYGPWIMLAASFFMLFLSAVMFPSISRESEENRADEVMAKNVRKYKEIHKD